MLSLVLQMPSFVLITWSKINVKTLTLLALPCGSVSYAEVYDLHSEPYETREAF